MLAAHELNRLCERLGLSAEARAVVETIRLSPPARRVLSAAGNVSVRYPSRKMGVTIQAESHRVELAALYEYEHDPRTLEFYDQPPTIKLVYEAKNGRQLGVWHTPDYFVIRNDEVVWEEWKTETGLEQLAQTMPSRYVRDETARWRCPPGERFAEQLGLYYRLRSSAEIDWVLQRNLRFLDDYLTLDPGSINQQSADVILKLVKEQPGVHLDTLFELLDNQSVDDIYALIASNRIYIDLHATPLAEPDRVRVFRDAETARAFELVGIDEHANERFNAHSNGRLVRGKAAQQHNRARAGDACHRGQYAVADRLHDVDTLRPPLIVDRSSVGERFTGIGDRENVLRANDMLMRESLGIISVVLYGPDHRTRLTEGAARVVHHLRASWNHRRRCTAVFVRRWRT